MSALERLAAGLLAAVVLAVAGGLYVRHLGAERYEAGYAAAVAAGDATRDRQAETYRATEAALRADLAARDAAAFTKEKEYASNLEAAQRRIRAGIDSLRCPARPVPAGAAPGDRPAAGGPAGDAAGPAIVPEAAGDLLGIAADVAGLVRRYERVVERFEECRAVNAQ